MYVKMDVKKVMYTVVREGKLARLKELLEHREKDEVVKLVSTTSHGTTPLVIACRNGHYDVAEYLIEKCGANVNQPGLVMFDGEMIERAPPLWCAAAAGHLVLVKLLVKNGARVNATTKTLSTPLRAACFDGHLDIVRFLVDHGADIEMANRHGHTSLMIACYKSHLKIVKFLLTLKANVNRKSIKGNTALHDCAESGSLEVVKVLLKHGARMDVDSYGMSPLLTAAVTGHKHIVEYFISMPQLVNRKERIDALELLGATYVDKRRDMMGALQCWKEAMNERYQSDPVIPKPGPPPLVAAYDFAREITDPEALDGLLNDPDEMRMQALVIRERILGPAHPDTSYYIRYRGAVYADGGMFSRCIELWNYALDMQQSMLEPLDPMTQSSLFSFTELFTFMIGRQINAGRRVPQIQKEELLRVFKKAVLEVKLGKQMLDKGSARGRDIAYLNRVLITTLHLASLLTHEMPEEDTAEYSALHQALYELVRANPKDNNDRTVLHLVFSERNTIFGAGPRSPSFRFPSPQLIKALLKVGADVSAKDATGSTVLHLAAMFHPSIDLVNILLDAGAHIDAVNKMGSTFESLIWSNNVYEALVRNKYPYDSIYPMRYIKLTCLAARVVRKAYDIESVPKHLQDFVQMH
ncbi:protein fem-1 homolog CG6966 isoform X1 [Bombus vancouverensis nearcticus]|uniref:protein fem-1 homolog CG6966 isoform X1 n=1 Tax=Bombus vancouverensis nearcticus TaxID=2705178 RepID=UPI00143C6D83|nr:protein fem-1 homolog CG6966 isoform X1 [Bombus vancouverensis nearcticus]